MATMSFYASGNMLVHDKWSNNISSQLDSTRIKISDNTYPNNYVEFIGSFDYKPNGDLASGTVTGYDFGNGVGTIYSLYGIDVNALTIKKYVVSGNLLGLEKFVLSGNDTINGSDADDTLCGWNGDDTIKGNGGSDICYGGNGNDLFITGKTSNNQLDIGSDTLYGEAGIDTFHAYGGSNTVKDLGKGGADILQVESGATLDANVNTAWTASATTYNSGTINIHTIGKAVNLNLAGGPHGYHIDNTGKATTLTGSAFADEILAGSGNDKLFGGAGQDKLHGGIGKNTINGGEGSDTIIGGKGQDLLWGGGVDAKDIFQFATGDSGITSSKLDKIFDFQVGAVGSGDLIDFTSANLVVGSTVTVQNIDKDHAYIDPITGIATFYKGSGTSLGDAVKDIANSFAVNGTVEGEFALFQIKGKGDYYLFISDNQAGAGPGDVVVQLVGVNTVSAIDIGGGDLTILPSV